MVHFYTNSKWESSLATFIIATYCSTNKLVTFFINFFTTMLAGTLFLLLPTNIDSYLVCKKVSTLFIWYNIFSSNQVSS